MYLWSHRTVWFSQSLVPTERAILRSIRQCLHLLSLRRRKAYRLDVNVRSIALDSSASARGRMHGSDGSISLFILPFLRKMQFFKISVYILFFRSFAFFLFFLSGVSWSYRPTDLHENRHERVYMCLVQNPFQKFGKSQKTRSGRAKNIEK